MDWIKRLNLAIKFIEENLNGELDYEDVAGIAGCPSYYFQQMFLYMTDMTLREYIRRRRLSLAAVELQKGNRKVTDIAMKYGYESPTAFTRAFKNFHGTTPSAGFLSGISAPFFFHGSTWRGAIAVPGGRKGGVQAHRAVLPVV